MAVAVFVACAAGTTSARADVEACAAAAEDSERAFKAERLREARTRLSACLAADCPAVLRASCAETLAAVEASNPSIVVSIRRGDGSDVVNATLRVDNAAARTGGAIEIDPGKHILEASESERRVRLEIVAHSGEKRRNVTLLLEDPHAASPQPQPLPSAAPEQQSRVPRWLGPSLLGLGGLGLASFTYFGLSARSDVDNLQQDCAPRCGADRIDDGRSKALVADISLGVAVVALATGAYFLFVAK